MFNFVNFNILPKEEEIAKIVNDLYPNKAYTSEIKPIFLKLGGLINGVNYIIVNNAIIN